MERRERTETGLILEFKKVKENNKNTLKEHEDKQVHTFQVYCGNSDPEIYNEDLILNLDGITRIKLYFDINSTFESITFKDLFYTYADTNETFFENISKSFIDNGYDVEYKWDSNLRVYKVLFMDEIFVKIVTDEIGNIIGYIFHSMFNSDECSDFFFINESINKNYMLNFVSGIEFGIIDGGKIYNLRNVINIGENELGLLLCENYLNSDLYLNIKSILVSNKNQKIPFSLENNIFEVLKENDV